VFIADGVRDQLILSQQLCLPVPNLSVDLAGHAARGASKYDMCQQVDEVR